MYFHQPPKAGKFGEVGGVGGMTLWGPLDH